MASRTLIWQDRSLKWGFAVLTKQGTIGRIRSGFLSPITAQMESRRRSVELLPYCAENRVRCDDFSIRSSSDPEKTRLRLAMAHAADVIRALDLDEGSKVSVSYCPDLDDRSLTYIEHDLEIRRTGDLEMTASKDTFEIVVILDDGEPNPYVSEVLPSRSGATL